MPRRRPRPTRCTPSSRTAHCCGIQILHTAHCCGIQIPGKFVLVKGWSRAHAEDAEENTDNDQPHTGVPHRTLHTAPAPTPHVLKAVLVYSSRRTLARLKVQAGKQVRLSSQLYDTKTRCQLHPCTGKTLRRIHEGNLLTR
jgi:hypothetical protein